MNVAGSADTAKAVAHTTEATSEATSILNAEEATAGATRPATVIS